MTENLSDKFKIPDKAQARTSPASNMSHKYEENYYFILYGSVLSNRRPFQQLRAYKRHKENKSKIGQEWNSMQQAHYKCHRPIPWMQESVSMHKSPTPVRHSRMNQARLEKEEKERKRGKKDRGQEADGKKGSSIKQNTSEELKEALPRHSSG